MSFIAQLTLAESFFKRLFHFLPYAKFLQRWEKKIGHALKMPASGWVWSKNDIQTKTIVAVQSFMSLCVSFWSLWLSPLATWHLLCGKIYCRWTWTRVNFSQIWTLEVQNWHTEKCNRERQIGIFLGLSPLEILNQCRILGNIGNLYHLLGAGTFWKDLLDADSVVVSTLIISCPIKSVCSERERENFRPLAANAHCYLTLSRLYFCMDDTQARDGRSETL